MTCRFNPAGHFFDYGLFKDSGLQSIFGSRLRVKFLSAQRAFPPWSPMFEKQLKIGVFSIRLVPINLILKVKKGESTSATKQSLRHVDAETLPHPFLSL